MFDVGFAELVLLFMLGLIVLGPEKLPRIAAQIGRWVGRARRTATQLRYQLEREINLEDRPRRPYTPPPKTSQIVPPPGAQRDDDAVGAEDAGVDTGEAPAKASDASPSEPDRDTGT